MYEKFIEIGHSFCVILLTHKQTNQKKHNTVKSINGFSRQPYGQEMASISKTYSLCSVQFSVAEHFQQVKHPPNQYPGSTGPEWLNGTESSLASLLTLLTHSFENKWLL